MIEVSGLTKQFDVRTVLNCLNLSIDTGEIFGLLGPNGAGKTTTIRLLTMLTKPSGGIIRINGLSFEKNEQQIKSLLGIVPQHLNLDIELTARENLELHGRLHGIPTAERNRRITELLEFVELTDRSGDMVQTFSGGMKRRLMIARALLHRPKVLFLDEPTVGLDPQVRRRIWELVRHLASEGMTVLLTTHYIEEAQALCQRVAIIDKGHLIALDTPQTLCQGLGEYVVDWEENEQRHNKFFPNRVDAASYSASLTTTVIIRRSNLEDVFVELTGRKVVER
ncbi:MAG: drrA 2 [Firmicutes bacterium]|nr:drrA 2 [Bacillota bacterium]